MGIITLDTHFDAHSRD
jgi:hypothetical protein